MIRTKSIKTINKTEKVMRWLEACKKKKLCDYIELSNEKVAIFYDRSNALFVRCLELILRDIIL